MALYEHLLIARQDISAQQVDALATHLKTIVEGEGGKVEKQEYWGLRGLAYRIKKNRKGHYVLLNINAPAKAVVELERQLKINEDVLRYITVSVDAFEVSSNKARRDDRPEGERKPEGIEAEAAGAGERIRAEADAEASRTYASAFGQDAKFYQFLRTLQAYEKILDDKTTVFLPADAEVLRMLHFDVHPTPGEPSPGAAAPVGAAGPPQGPNGLSADADRLLKRKSGEELR